MTYTLHFRDRPSGRCLGAWVLCCFAITNSGQITWAQAPATQVQAVHDDAQPGQVESSQNASLQPASGTGAPTAVTGVGAHTVESAASKRHVRDAVNAYLAGARKLERDDLNGAEREFAHALTLDPENRDYAIAISVTRQHRVTELVQKAGRARLAGEQARAETLLADARAIDPQNPIVIEHSGPAMVKSASALPSSAPGDPASGQVAGKPDDKAGNANSLAHRVRMLPGSEAREPWNIQAPALAGAVRLTPTLAVQSFHLRGTYEEVVRHVASAYGIRAIFEESVERKNVRFDLDDAPYQQAMGVLIGMTHLFAVPVDETSVLVAKDSTENRQRLERQLEETIYLPGSTAEQINELANVVRTIFDVRQATVQTSLGSIVVRAPEETLGPMNRTLEDLMDGSGEVMVEVKLYEVDTTGTRKAGATIPTQAGIYNVDQAATALVNANRSLVQQAIAQGLGNPPLTASSSDLLIAGELIASGLVQSSLLSSTIATFGGKTTLTGITETGSVAFNLGQNSSDTRALDDVQMRVGDREPATFREGTRYPITTSTYSTGLSTAASALSNASINGVSVASLLAQFAGGTSATIPQVSYEDLGVTLKATPAIQKTGRINLLLDLKIEALAGGSANGIPVLQSRQFASDITVADGESVLMVSNVTRNESAATTGIPGLSELPGFQMPIDQNSEKDTSQLVVVVTPHVVRMRSDVIAGPRIAMRAQSAN